MTAAGSTLVSTLRRYRRSRGIWLLMLVAPIGARFWVPRDDGMAMTVAVGGRVPTMTPAMIGLSLGIVVATSFLPVAWGYLRANTTRTRPWQVEDTTPASRIAQSLGRFGADVVVFAAMMTALTVAGCVLAALTTGRPAPGAVAIALWLVGLPPLLCLAGLRRLFDALPIARRAPGDVMFFLLWMTLLTLPFAGGVGGAGSWGALRDFGGFVRPLSGGAAAAPPSLAIGLFPVRTGHVPIDVAAGLGSDGYVLSRLAWCAIGSLLAVAAGLLYHPPTPRRRAIAAPRRRIATPTGARAAPRSSAPWPQLVLHQGIAIAGGRASTLVGAAIAIAGAFVDARHLGGPAALLWLVFGLAREGARWETPGTRTLATLTATAAPARRAALVAAGTVLSVAMATPAAIGHGSAYPLILGIATGGVAACVAVALAAATRTASAPRLVLLIAWYGYFSS